MTPHPMAEICVLLFAITTPTKSLLDDLHLNFLPVALVFSKVFYNRIASRWHSSESGLSWVADSMLITHERYKLDNALHCKCYFLTSPDFRGGTSRDHCSRFQDFVNTTGSFSTLVTASEFGGLHTTQGCFHWFGFLITLDSLTIGRPCYRVITIGRKEEKSQN